MRLSDVREVAAAPWDAIVIGTGMGGATFGYALASSGWKVLFCEKGLARGAEDIAGQYPESLFDAKVQLRSEHAQVLRRAGRCSDSIEDRSKARSFVPFIGCGAGGSSALYGMAMERLFPADFTPAASHHDATGATHPDAWPISYDELAPHYGAAERLYRVRGGQDPLRADSADLAPPPPFTAAAASLIRHLEARGLHPYRLPCACEYVADCQTCQGFLCQNDCKNDSARVCLKPALERHGAVLVDDCEVVRLRASRRTVDTVECLVRGSPVSLKGRIVVLAAGALVTPVVLLRSTSADWVDGLANGSGLVGRNLMRHLLDLYALQPPDGPASDNRAKELAFNDFYLRDGTKLGTVQSFGRLPPVDMVLQSLLEDVRAGRLRWGTPVARGALTLLRPGLERLIGERMILAATMEDLPYSDNRVEPSGNRPRGIAMRYEVRTYERSRIARFRSMMKAALKPLRFRLLGQIDRNERIAHACGTCRFGDDPSSSVLDRNCRAHELDNLYVVDSSFFPTSGGTNPSLTIAANALRVAAVLGGTKSR